MPKREGAGRKTGVTKAAIDARVSIITELIIRGFTLGKIRELLKQNKAAKGSQAYRPELDWDVQDRALRSYYKQANDALAKMSAMSIEMELALAKSRYEDLYQRAVQKNALGVAARVLRDKVELLTLRQFTSDATRSHLATDDDKGEEAQNTTQFRLGDGTTIDL